MSDAEIREAMRTGDKRRERILRWRPGEDVGFMVGDRVRVIEGMPGGVISGYAGVPWTGVVSRLPRCRHMGAPAIILYTRKVTLIAPVMPC